MAANEKQVAGSHYKKLKIQHWDYVVANDIPYLEAQVIKYVTRHKDKHGIQDLEKAQHFLEKLIEVEKAKVPATRGSYSVLADLGSVCLCRMSVGDTTAVNPECKVHAP